MELEKLLEHIENFNRLVCYSTDEINSSFTEETSKFTKSFLKELRKAELECKPEQVKVEKEKICKLYAERIDFLLEIPERTHKFFESELATWREEDAKRTEKQDQ